ncbi:unnamed protein product [Linum trigynum]|uniref:Uncharacterized protein n=1 Tax=Linum trigynum TaxID=586398 RepID=A0AAV2FJL0_9ROSI
MNAPVLLPLSRFFQAVTLHMPPAPLPTLPLISVQLHLHSISSIPSYLTSNLTFKALASSFPIVIIRVSSHCLEIIQ